MKRVPIVPTIVVVLAALLMVALGVWQLERSHEKAALLAELAAAPGKPPIAFPIVPVANPPLFRRSSIMCLEPVGWRVEAGRDRTGRSGWRHIAACRTGAEGPGASIDMGWSADFGAKPRWAGGRVAGTIGSLPDHRSLVSTLTEPRSAPQLLLIADTPAPGLAPSAVPTVDEIPNSHLSYAIQWFSFAAIAVAVYVLALRRRAPAHRSP